MMHLCDGILVPASIVHSKRISLESVSIICFGQAELKINELFDKSAQPKSATWRGKGVFELLRERVLCIYLYIGSRAACYKWV